MKKISKIRILDLCCPSCLYSV